jgi:hypothetical protein
MRKLGSENWGQSRLSEEATNQGQGGAAPIKSTLTPILRVVVVVDKGATMKIGVRVDFLKRRRTKVRAERGQLSQL